MPDAGAIMGSGSQEFMVLAEAIGKMRCLVALKRWEILMQGMYLTS